jgi:hypothetical protein
MSVTRVKSEWSGGNLVFTADPTFYVRFKGITKFHNRPTTDAFAVEIKSEFTGTNTGHKCVEVTADWKGNGVAGGGNWAVVGVSRVAADKTMAGGSLIGTYGQVCNNGTINGAGAMVAGLYGLIEDGGTYTAVSHVCSAWLDSHLTKTVSAGNSEILYMTNNGSTTLGNAFYIYAGNKITNLFTIDTAAGMVSDATEADYVFTKTRKIKIVAGGETGYLIMDIPE